MNLEGIDIRAAKTDPFPSPSRKANKLRCKGEELQQDGTLSVEGSGLPLSVWGLDILVLPKPQQYVK